VHFSDACKNAGQSGLISCGIAQEIRETQTDEVIFWTIENLIDRLEITDFDKLKVFSDLCSKKLAEQLDNFTNKETDHKKASVLGRIDFYQANRQIQEIK
jgi:hypothetical protein